MKNAQCPWGVGAKTQTNIVFEDEYGKLPENAATRTINMPFNSNNVASSQNSTDPATIRGDRNPVEPIMGNIDINGDIVVPVDFTAMGFWLAAAIGIPESTLISEGKYQHIFKVGDGLPSFTIEKAFPGIGQYVQSHGCKVSKTSFSFGGDGELTATVSIMGANEEILHAAMGNDVIAPDFDRANNFQCEIKIGDQTEGKATSLSLDIDNGLDGDTYTIGSHGFRSAICDGLAKVSGTMEAFFKDSTYLEMAEKSEKTKLEIIIKMNEDMQLSILLPEIKFARTSPGIDGPAGIKQSLSFNGFYQDNEYNSAAVITLKNKYKTYDFDAEPSVELSVPEGEVYGKQVTDLQNGLAFKNGVATGQLKKVTDYTGFNGTVVSEQNGYFLPFVATLPEGSLAATMAVIGGSGKKVSIKDEPYNVAFLGATKEEAQARYVQIEYTDNSTTRILKIDTSKLTYEE